ncbi:hypothetical protein ES332_D13G263000v1 [Gossypium tomentosum]|uniref:TF-B3 domain-containing protein n=1 Tax=Gossypium tomentosum TaxID=34277 RepID=A0A5D2I2B0_GOSTO|nr:hypothetical protein ES332_D13G263000v1 [Gossypium tomentosum]
MGGVGKLSMKEVEGVNVEKQCLGVRVGDNLRWTMNSSWKVEYERRGRSKCRKAVFGGKSSGLFAMDNEFEVGDVCVFELMNENGNLLEVVIHCPNWNCLMILCIYSMELRVADGRSWKVEYERRGRSKGRKAVFGGKSWGQFAMDNEFEVGDVCVFELMNENGNLLEVVIHRKLLLVEIN